MSVEDFKHGASWHRRNMMAAASISTWIGKQKGKRKVLVLYGAAHYLGEGNIKEQLDRAGLKTVVLVPFLPAWEIALRKRFGNNAERGWHEVRPGVLRAPFVTDDEIRKVG